MSAAQRESMELQPRSPSQMDDVNAPTFAVEAIPNGGYGWVVVFACSTVTFIFNGWSGSWGILQAALLNTYLKRQPASTLSFVGSLSIALTVALGLPSSRLAQMIGARYSMLLGVLLMSFGSFLSSFTVGNIGGLFATAGVLFGLGTSLTYTACNSLPMQWFSSKLGTANGLVKLGGGIGATIMALVLQAIIDKFGIQWAFRFFGFVSFISGIPAALLIRERAPSRSAPFVDLSLFRSMSFCCLFVAGGIGTFALFVPSFFLPLFASSIGLSTSVGAGIVASFNACTAIGRFAAGFACDKFGSTNMLLLTMALNTISMLAIWPVSDKMGPLFLFAIINGVANGAFFVTMPMAIGRMMGPSQATVGMAMAVTGWTGGYLIGSPIAGFLIAATGAEKAHAIMPYRPAIFYSGSVALASAIFVLIARINMDHKVFKRI